MVESDKRSVLIAANPKSGATESGHIVAELREAILGRGFPCELHTSLDEVCNRANQLAERNELRAIVSAGGDGTADALANRVSNQVPLLLFPLGTENLLARYHGLKADITHACHVLKTGNQIRMDVGQANDNLFLVMASCGFDAEVVNEMDRIRTGHINRWSYTRPILRALSRYRFPRLTVRSQSSESRSGQNQATPTVQHERQTAWLFVFNIPMYAANLDFCPQADPNDGLLDFCMFRQGGIATGLGYFLRLFMKSHQSMKGFEHWRASQAEVFVESKINMPEKPASDENQKQNKRGTAPVSFQVDGDPGGTLPLELKVLPERLSLLVPTSHTDPAP
ncbi:MAG: diacylglycerol/lipid kinase family protein [Aureliella sp.]